MSEEIIENPAVESAEEIEEQVIVKPAKKQSNASVDNDKFDWDAFENDGFDAGEKAANEESYSKSLSRINENEVVEGTVTAINKREVIVNIGYKSEGVISINEFRYNPDLAVGDTVEVYVENAEDKKGQLILSHKRARAVKSWDRVNEAFAKDEIVKGYIKCRTKGGMIVDVFGIEAFLPGSQIDVKPIRDYDVFVNKTMEFKIVKINQEFRNVVVSHKALIEAEIEAQKADIIAKLEKGQVLEGTVKNITSYGVFVDLGGVDGLIHITDLSWGRISHPEEVVSLDQKINVVILDFDDTKKRIALGLKQLTPHPWDALDPNLKVGDTVKGKVVVIADYGAFVEVQPGVEGLIHVSEMSWSLHLRSAQDFLKVGQEVEAVILTLDREERKMSLGIKQLKPDPWATITEKYPINSKHTATVRNFTNFGVFVELEEGVDGLVHISDLSWTKKIKHPSEFTSIGEPIEVVVLEVDQENRRLSLGHKQLEENPWNEYENTYTVGSVHEGTVTAIVDKGATITLADGITGFCSNRNLVKEDGTTAKEGEKLPFKVTEFNKGSKKITLSHTRTYEEVRREEARKEAREKESEANTTQKAVRKLKDNLERTTLGDISDLADLKSRLEAEEKANQE
ncbi:MAG: 30S ribosomal protein S1 [Bacteroidales bacterium]|nr:30S ribosomal protein S1 [Bacteroidales bacterium]MBQ3744100.1 30S ribosomal protein S1 [Bacteroidales bacterium]MBQ5438611.1 30S ribosomal protein S1 [Bacteroidales bacterium]MBQ5529433.1 30S ribosomal protein S1 [Bacteroidales bacterium]